MTYPLWEFVVKQVPVGTLIYDGFWYVSRFHQGEVHTGDPSYLYRDGSWFMSAVSDKASAYFETEVEARQALDSAMRTQKI